MFIQGLLSWRQGGARVGLRTRRERLFRSLFVPTSCRLPKRIEFIRPASSMMAAMSKERNHFRKQQSMTVYISAPRKSQCKEADVACYSAAESENTILSRVCGTGCVPRVDAGERGGFP